MTPIEFFKKACLARRYKEKAWVFSVFGCTLTKPEQLHKGKLYDVHRIDGIPYWVDADGEYQKFDEFTDTPNVPLLQFRDRVDLETGDIPNLTGSVNTTIGNLFVNWYTLVHALGTKIPFQLGEITTPGILKLIRPKFSSDLLHPDGTINYEGQDSNVIYAHEYVRYIQCTTALAGFVPISVPSATPYTLQTSPEIPKLKAELLEKYKDSLDDPTVIAKIEAELLKVDRAFVESDPDRGFYIKDKSFNIVRKKLFLMGGIEANFNGDGGFTLVKNSLKEGPTVETLPAMIDTLRNGSYSRGTLTALGGEAVKFFQRVLQNSRVVGEDCGVTYGVPVAITEENHGDYVGRYRFVSGKTVPIGKETAALIGQTIELRSPMACRAGFTDYCACCMGDNVAASPTGLPAMGSNMGSVFMDALMKAGHFVELKVKHWDPMKHVS